MSVISIEQAMQHLRADSEDQAYVALVLEAAEDSASQFLNRRFYADDDALASAVLTGDAGADPILVNPSIRAACLLIAGNLYGNREDIVVGTITSELPIGSRSMLMPYRIGLGV
ncbi:Phage gp6-like head-tail connector protein [Pseudomonas sp. PM2]|uniref:head-tail connector protein n=1 Tax=Pseudomonas sp. PM2 TaxID=215172 RepID=UPI003FA1A16A